MRAGYMWGVPFFAGFIVGYAGGSTTRLATDYLTDWVNAYNEMPPFEDS